MIDEIRKEIARIESSDPHRKLNSDALGQIAGLEKAIRIIGAADPNQSVSSEPWTTVQHEPKDSHCPSVFATEQPVQDVHDHDAVYWKTRYLLLEAKTKRESGNPYDCAKCGFSTFGHYCSNCGNEYKRNDIEGQ